MKQQKKWFCAQLGGREHYAVPRALHISGALGELMTDYWAGPVSRLLASRVRSNGFRSLAARFHPDIPPELVKSWNGKALNWQLQSRRMARKGGTVSRYLDYCDVGRCFARALSHHMAKKSSIGDDSIYFGYDTASLEIIQHLKQRGVFCILDQIDPCRVEIEMVRAEQDAWPDWQDGRLEVPDEYFERHVQEWQLADRVVVNSEFSRDALVLQGVPKDKLFVVPLSYERGETARGRFPVAADTELRHNMKRFSADKPMRVLFLGQVMLRKGIQYLTKAAELLDGSPIAFDIVGPAHITKRAIDSTPSNMIFHGRVARGDTHRWYRAAHVFALPTLSDGFALTQLEAMSHGTPVVATPNCGDVVTDGVDGFLVPPRDPESIARVLTRYLDNPDLLESHQLAALEKSRQFSLNGLGLALRGLER